jgi:hypothetical protein
MASHSSDTARENDYLFTLKAQRRRDEVLGRPSSSLRLRDIPPSWHAKQEGETSATSGDVEACCKSYFSDIFVLPAHDNSGSDRGADH